MRVPVVLFIMFSFVPSLYAATLSEVIGHPDNYDGKRIVVSGEAVGEVIKAKDGAWVNIRDGDCNLGVFFKNTAIPGRIEHFGSYHMRGDIVRVEGVFHKVCPLHAERDIHGDKLTVVKKGGPILEKVDPRKEQLAFVMVIICLTLSLVYLIKLKYARGN